MRLLALHVITGGATLLILAALALPAKRALDQPAARRPPAAPAVLRALRARRRSRARVRRLRRSLARRRVGRGGRRGAAGGREVPGVLEHATLAGYAEEARRKGIRRMMVAWEPWAPVPSALGVAAQARPQPGYRNVDIARGVQDRLIMRFARELARFPGTVLAPLRARDERLLVPVEPQPARLPVGVAAGRAARARGRRATTSASSGRSTRTSTSRRDVWRATLRRYWPGTPLRRPGRHDDDRLRRHQGLRGPRVRAAAARAPARSTASRSSSRRRTPSCAAPPSWLGDLRRMLARMPLIRGVYWSQLPSRGKVQQAGTGVVDWDVQRVPTAAAQLAMIIRDGAARSGAR